MGADSTAGGYPGFSQPSSFTEPMMAFRTAGWVDPARNRTNAPVPRPGLVYEAIPRFPLQLRAPSSDYWGEEQQQEG
jgi:hypothetical protein